MIGNVTWVAWAITSVLALACWSSNPGAAPDGGGSATNVSAPFAPLRFLLILLLSAQCGPAGGAKSTGANVTASHVNGPPGVELVMACTPTGPELCFNAIDDNCNGIIDEGCGLATGVLQFTIAWGDSPANVDLRITAPNGETVSPRERATESGFHLDRDCPRDNCNQQNVENAFFDGGDPPRGHYKVEIWLEDLNKAEVPVHVRFGARVGIRTFGADVDLSRESERKTFGFDL